MPHSSSQDPVRLARSVDRLRGMVLVLAAGFVLLLALQFTPRPVLEAERFVLRDSARVFRGALEMRSDGAAVVRLNDSDARPRFYAMVMPDGRPKFRLTDKAGYHHLQAELDPDDRVHLRLADDEGDPRLHLWVDDDGRPWILWRDSTGTHPLELRAPAAAGTRGPARR